MSKRPLKAWDSHSEEVNRVMFWKKYGIEQVLHNKIAITFPTKKEYEIFIQYVKDNKIRCERLKLCNWDEWKKNTCAIYRDMCRHGFQVNSKKLIKHLRFEKFIKFKQLILKDTKIIDYYSFQEWEINQNKELYGD